MADEQIMALTIKQPWAHLIATCGKTVENRTWVTPYRGLLAIHAGAYSGWDRGAETDPVAIEGWKHYAGTRDGRLAIPLTRGDAFSYFTFGAVIAVADLAGCHHESTEQPRNSCSAWGRPDQYHWGLANIRRLYEPVPCRGKLGLWRLPGDVEEQVRKQLEAAGV